MSESIFALWRNWAVGVGTLACGTMLSPIVSIKALILINLLAILFLQFYNRWMESDDHEVSHCTRNLNQVSIIFVVVTLCLIPVYFFANTEGATELTGQPFSQEAPMLVQLITGPITVIVTACFLLKRKEPAKCKKCKLCYDNVLERSFIGDLYRREWRYQTAMLLILALALSVVCWVYYLEEYVNTNISHVDRFLFMWLPLLLYVLSLIFLGNRYYMTWVYYCKNDEKHLVERDAQTCLRYLVLCGDHILLQYKPVDNVDGQPLNRYDTPVVEHVPYHEVENLAEAISVFQRATGIKDADIRPIYDSPDRVTHQNVFHYFAFLNSPREVENSKVSGEWMSWGNVVQLDHQYMLNRPFLAELRRIYDVMMASKTYDKNGRRLYKIKNYRPTFHLRDLRNRVVDFNDGTWLRVAQLNQDKFLFSIRRLFYRPVKNKQTSR